MSAEIFVGMDVSHACVDVAVHPGMGFQIPNDESGIVQAVERLHALQPTLIVLEATGGLEVPLTGALASAGLPVVVINPRQVRDFARDGILEFGPRRRIGRQLKQGIFLHFFPYKGPEGFFHVVLIPVGTVLGDEFRRATFDHVRDEEGIEGNGSIFRRDNIEMLRILNRTDIHIHHFRCRCYNDPSRFRWHRINAAMTEEIRLLNKHAFVACFNRNTSGSQQQQPDCQCNSQHTIGFHSHHAILPS